MIRLSTFADNGKRRGEERRDGITASTNCEIDSNSYNGGTLPWGGRKGKAVSISAWSDIRNIFWPNNPMKRARGERWRVRGGREGGRKEGRGGNCGRDSISKSDKGEDDDDNGTNRSRNNMLMRPLHLRERARPLGRATPNKQAPRHLPLSFLGVLNRVSRRRAPLEIRRHSRRIGGTPVVRATPNRVQRTLPRADMEVSKILKGKLWL